MSSRKYSIKIFKLLIVVFLVMLVSFGPIVLNEGRTSSINDSFYEETEILKFPSKWSMSVIPIQINYYLFLHTWLEYNDSLKKTIEWENIENNLALLTPWGENVSLPFIKTDEFDLVELQIPNSQGSGYMNLFGHVKQNGTIKLTNGLTQQYKIDDIFINKSKLLEWNISNEITPIEEIDWTYIDYSYWPPHPGWRVIINKEYTQYLYVADRHDWYSVDELNSSLKLVKTDELLWEEIEQIVTNYSAYNWGTFVYSSENSFSTDGYSFQNTVKLFFKDKIVSLTENDGDQAKSWIPTGFSLIEEKLNSLITNLRNKELNFDFD
ncbi:MAG: hypothetical protein ACFFD1_08645, partial [Candidatus Thorarchaeota archaeon]